MEISNIIDIGIVEIGNNGKCFKCKKYKTISCYIFDRLHRTPCVELFEGQFLPEV